MNIPRFELDELVTKIQKVIKGYLTRKHRTKVEYQGLRLLTFTKRHFDGQEYLIYAYLQGAKIRIEAQNSGNILVMHIDNKLLEQLGTVTRKQILDKIIIPSLYIEVQGHVFKLCIEEKIKVSQNQNQIRIVETPDIQKQKIFKLPVGHRRTISNTDTAFSSKTPTVADGLETRRSARFRNSSVPSEKYPLLLKAGRTQNKKYYIISIYLIEIGFLIEAEQIRKNRSAFCEFKCEIPKNSKEIDNLCSYILDKVEINEQDEEIIVNVNT